VRAAADAQEIPAGKSAMGIQWLLGTACGLIVANLYYGQPLAGLIGAALHLPPASTGLVVTLPQVGYGLGLLMIVPLGDLFENRRLVLTLIAIEAACLVAISTLAQLAPFFAVEFVFGAVATAVQVLVPYVTYLVPEAERGRAVGRVISGLMIGIMLARPLAGFVAHVASWQVVYQMSAVLMVVLFVVLRLALPARRPEPGLTYGQLLASLGRIFVTTGLLRRRGLYHACMFAAFSIFWTAAPLWLSGPQFGLSQQGIAWVALAGVAGAVAPAFAGPLADRGYSQVGTALALLMAALSFVASDFAHDGSHLALALVIATAVLLDFAVSANLVFSQRAIYALGAAQRSRLNGLFMATFFVGGAIGSALSAWCYTRFGWAGVSAVGIAFPLFALLCFASDPGWRRSGEPAGAT
jgi:predicted MFS family arabinose efflux permease